MDTVTQSSTNMVGFLAKWTLDGACLWVRPVSTSAVGTTIFSITIDPQGQLMLAGVTGEYLSTQVGSVQLAPGSFLARCDTDGHVLWARQLMAYGPQQRKFSIFSLKNIGQDVVGYGQAYMYTEQDTIQVDEHTFMGGTGGGVGLVRISTATGQAQWLRVFGYPGSILGPTAPERIAVDAAGDILCIGPWYDSAVFASDTLVNPGLDVQSYCVRLSGSGTETSLLDLRPGSGGRFSLNSINLDGSGSMLIGAALAGTMDLCGAQLSSTGWSSLLLRMDPLGECMAVQQTGPGVHASVVSTDQGIHAMGTFPAEGPTGSTTIGTSTYTTHGWSDIILAKHDLLTGIASKSTGDDRLLIYANPNQGSFRLVLPEALRLAPKLALRVYDATGREIHQQVLGQEEERPQVDVWHVSPGFYMVTVSDGRRTYSGSMVVE